MLLAAPAGRRRGNVLGHFAALRWQAKGKHGEGAVHEVAVIAEHLNRKAEDIVETLIHEAAHAMNFARGIRDCSSSQHHNRRFKAAAEELGLVVERVPHYGYALTRLPFETADTYAAPITELAKVLAYRRSRFATSPTGGSSDTANTTPKPSSRSRKATCACGFIIRVAKATLAQTTIRCDSCGHAFEL
ncbi:MAG: SprT-like domain-containing protein [Deltaproteobacteria bacterium]